MKAPTFEHQPQLISIQFLFVSCMQFNTIKCMSSVEWTLEHDAILIEGLMQT